MPGAKVALQHNLGLGGAAVVTVYRKAAFAYASLDLTEGFDVVGTILDGRRGLMIVLRKQLAP